MKKTSLDWAVPAEEEGEQCFDGPEAAIIGFTHKVQLCTCHTNIAVSPKEKPEGIVGIIITILTIPNGPPIG